MRVAATDRVIVGESVDQTDLWVPLQNRLNVDDGTL